MTNNKKKSKFKKMPVTTKSLTEESFVNRAEEMNVPNKEGEIKTFLLRMPVEIKKKLKKVSYLTENNMNQICLNAIEDYINNNFKDMKI